MRKMAPLTFQIGLTLLTLSTVPAVAAESDEGSAATRPALDSRLEILRSEISLVARQNESLQRETTGNLSAQGSEPNRPPSIGSRAASLDRLERRLTSLTLDWPTLSEAEASDRFHGLPLRVRRFQQETANDRYAWRWIRGQRMAGRSILPAPPYTGAITGTVTEEGSGTPPENLWVEIYDSVGQWVNSIQTNASKVYTSNAGLDRGDYFVRTYNDSGHVDEVYDDIQCVGWCSVTSGTPVRVTDGLTTSGIDFALTPGGRVSGRVAETDGFSGISGVYVEIYDSTGDYFTRGLSRLVWSVLLSDSSRSGDLLRPHLELRGL